MTIAVYLSNRHHDPTLATFISVDPMVDPMVVKTGGVYIHGTAIRISD